jgi:hypothetical protein
VSAALGSRLPPRHDRGDAPRQGMGQVVHLSNLRPPTPPTEPPKPPPVPRDCNLMGLPSLLLDIDVLLSSSFFERASDAGFRAGLTLWLRSMRRVPAGSLPDDDEQLAKLAGVSLTRWLGKRRPDGTRAGGIRDEALHKWELHSDGLLYHPVVTAKVRDAWETRLGQAETAIKGWRTRRQKAPRGGAKPAPAAAESGENPAKMPEKSVINAAFPDPNPLKSCDSADAGRMPDKYKDKSTESPYGDSGAGKPRQDPSPPPPPAPRKQDSLFEAEEDPWLAVRRQLWAEGRAIVGRLARGIDPDDAFGKAIGRAVKLLGGGAEAGTRVIHILRDIEAQAVAGKFADLDMEPTPAGKRDILRGLIVAKAQAQQNYRKGGNGGPAAAGAAAPAQPRVVTAATRAMQRARRRLDENDGDDDIGEGAI